MMCYRRRKSPFLACSFLCALIVLSLGAAEATLTQQAENVSRSVNRNINLFLPNNTIDLSAIQTFSRITTKYGIRYDLVDNNLDVNLNLRYTIAPYYTGVDLLDKIDFQAIYNDTAYFQRTRHFMPFVGWHFMKSTEAVLSMKFETTLTTAFNSTLTLDNGRNIGPSLGITRSDLDRSRLLPRGSSTELRFSGAFRSLGSDYEYTQADLDWTEIFYPIATNHYSEANIRLGYPVQTINKPLSSVYYTGGYEMLRGYQYREFYGDALAYVNIAYHIPLTKAFSMEAMDSLLNFITFDTMWEAASVGTRGEYSHLSSFRSSVSAGASFKLTALKNFNVKFNALIAQAFEPRSPILYFTISAYSYVETTPVRKTP